MVRCDLAQVEHRIGLMYCGTERLIPLANVRPETYDAFTEGAKAIFGVVKVEKQMRYLTKKVFHASWRQMGGEKMSESISKDTDGGLFVPARKCQTLINKHLQNFHEIEEIFFPWVRERVRNDGVLVNSWGRRMDLKHWRIDDDLYRKAYSFYMQSDAADWTNQYGFVPGHWWMMERYGRPLNAQVHDEVIASVPFEDAWEFADFIVKSMEQRREIPKGSGNYLTVPAGITVGRSWGDQKGVEFKRLEEREEFYLKLYKEGFYGS
jgi:DNA polymerase I-like protein with 3'-5' exonuclease and polymerase domains